MRLQLLKTSNGIPDNNEQKYSVLGLAVDLAEKEQTAQLSVLFTGEGLQAVMEGTTYYVVGTLLLFVPGFTDRSHDFMQKCDLTRMNGLSTERGSKVLFDQSGGAWVEGELVRQGLNIRKVKSVVQKMSAPPCLSGLLTLKFHVLDHLLKDLKRSKSFLLMNARPFGRCSVLMKNPCRLM